MISEPLGDLQALEREISTSDMDVVVAISPENVTYSSGVVIWTQRSLRDRLAMVVMPSKGDTTFLVAGQEAGYVGERSWIRDVRSYVAHGASPVQALVDVLREKGLAAGRIGIELGYLSTDYHRELVEALPEAQVVPCEHIFQRVRMVKTQAEVDLLTYAAVATDRAMMATYATIQSGDKERTLVSRLAGNMLLTGADKTSGLYLTVGPNTGHAHPSPTDYLAQPGDLVKTDCGAYYSGYLSDVARTAVIGKASPEQRSVYQRLMEVHALTIEAMRPGVPASDVFKVAVREYQRVDIPFSLAFAGHGIGLSGHEDPLLSAEEDTPLQPNMFFAVETRVRWPGREGYHIEDAVLITDAGPKILTTFMDTSRLMEL